jgi:hypothetical protein
MVALHHSSVSTSNKGYKLGPAGDDVFWSTRTGYHAMLDDE